MSFYEFLDNIDTSLVDFLKCAKHEKMFCALFCRCLSRHEQTSNKSSVVISPKGAGTEEFV